MPAAPGRRTHSNDMDILEYILKKGQVSYNSFPIEVGISKRNALIILRRLMSDGLIEIRTIGVEKCIIPLVKDDLLVEE